MTHEPPPAPIEIRDVGHTLGDDDTVYPTVVLDVADRPDVADLARVHATDGIGDITTVAVADVHRLLLGVGMTRPVTATFVVEFTEPDHLAVLREAATLGHLLLATTTPTPGETNPPWLAIDLDGDALTHTLDQLPPPR